MLFRSPRKTAHTITSVAAFERELALIRKRGYATAVGEAMEGVGSVAGAVLDARGTAVAAISLNGPLAEIVPSQERLGRLVQTACRKLARVTRPPGAG